MADGTAIEWTQATWNPLRGCSRVSPGCQHCYAETVAHRFSGPGRPYEGLVDEHGRWNRTLRVVDHLVEQPRHWRKPRRIFVNSMSDLFHENVDDEVLDLLFDVMSTCPQHTFQTLTKRADRQRAYLSEPRHRERYGARWPLSNVHVGVSIESLDYLHRADELSDTPASVRWWSAEPLLGDLGLLTRWMAGDRRGVDWVVVGGESGTGARPMHPAWARRIRKQAQHFGVPFFFKQWGAWKPHAPVYGDGDHMEVIGDLLEHPTHVALEESGIEAQGCNAGVDWNSHQPHPDAWWMVRVGKGQAGRLLDGRTYDEVPRVR